VLSEWVALAAAVCLAYALRDLVQGSPTTALELVIASVSARTLTGALVDELLVRVEQADRVHWHLASVHRLARSSPTEIHRLDTAIDHISADAALTAVEASAGAALFALALILYFGGWLCLLIVLALMALSVPAYISAGKSTLSALAAFHERRSTLVARQLRLLRSMTDLRALGAVSYGADEIAASSNAENRGVLAGVRVAIRSTLVTEFLGGVSVGLVAMVVGIRLWHHHIGLGPAMGAVLVSAEMFNALRRFGSEFHRRDDAQSAREFLNDSFREFTAHGHARLEIVKVTTAAPADAVSFRIGDRGRLRLQGPSGVGKSSLIETALGLREPIEGTVHRRAERVALIRPDNHFIRATLRENLQLSSNASDEQIHDALSEVGLFGDRFADLDVTLAEDGRDFSTGERVQLAVARALLSSPDLVVLDDVASSLDATTRERLARIFDNLDAAVLEASHELSLLTHPDDVIQMSAT
jgi:ABC-type transport system involved in cytochrome bd biosynthesis fused ATPase/permease subunit